tara:strand:- start:11584 stop:13419 length:1836 start_codon:yes stop_codon:yes gene_type:complete
MAGSPRRRIEKLKAEGKHLEADWLVARMKAKNRGISLKEWEMDNPKPSGLVDKSPIIFIPGTKLQVSNKTYGKNITIPFHDKEILSKIRESKRVVKQKARIAPKENIKTLYKVMQKLAADELKIKLRYDFGAFDEEFFQDIQDRVPTPKFHKEMFQLFEHSKRACVVCPRGHAKSTNARKYILHQILNEKVKYVIIVGASEDMAGQNLRWIRDQLTDNPKIIATYGNLHNKNKWSETEFITSTDIKVSAKGAEQKIRGANEKGRPDLFYIDDLEEDEQVSSRDRREKLRKWLVEALMPAKSVQGRIIMTGTILHTDSLLKNIALNKIRDHMYWDVLWYRALDENVSPPKALWPDMHSAEKLLALKEANPQSFSQEYQNDPRSGAMAVFKQEWYQYITEKDIRRDSIDKRIYVRGQLVHCMLTTDYAISEKEGADFTVLNMTGMDSDSNLYVLELERFRTSNIFEIVDMIFILMMKYFCEYMTSESVAFQTTMKKVIEKRMEEMKYFFFIKEMKRANLKKMYRIKALEAPIRNKKCFWQEEHVHLEDELNQVTATSLGKHDDIIDTLADAWQEQIEALEDDGRKTVKINSMEWLIEQGLLPTTAEEDNVSLY